MNRGVRWIDRCWFGSNGDIAHGTNNSSTLVGKPNHHDTVIVTDPAGHDGYRRPAER